MNILGVFYNLIQSWVFENLIKKQTNKDSCVCWSNMATSRAFEANRHAGTALQAEAATASAALQDGLRTQLQETQQGRFLFWKESEIILD